MTELAQIGSGRRGRDTTHAVRFCSACGELFEERARDRVCPACGMGVLLSSHGDALPGPRAPFLVVSADLDVTAVSVAGERLLGEATGRPLPALVSCRDGDGELARQVARAASGLSGTARLEVTVAGRRGGFEARVAPCGPPRAALVALARAED